MPLIRSISGLRATICDSLVPSLIAAYTAAFSEISPGGIIAIGRDGRQSGEWIEKTVNGTLSSAGRDVISLGIVPTPTVQIFAERKGFAGGIAITASHNPAEWNGLKFIGRDGTFLDGEMNKMLWEAVEADNSRQEAGKAGVISSISNALDYHIEKILEIPLVQSCTDRIRSRGYSIAVDAVNASGSAIVPRLLERLGCIVIPLYCDGSGIFPHTPEPLPENLGDLCKSVINNGADFGIAVDPDADRLVIIDGNGNPIGEERTVVLSIMSVFENWEYFEGKFAKAAVVNLSTTRLAEDIARKYGAAFYRSPVGEINVVKKMKEVSAAIGGEGSGGVIFPECHYGRDSLSGIALLLSLLAKTGCELSEIADSFPEYRMLKFKMQFTGNIELLAESLQNDFPDGKFNLDDGIRIDLEEGWVQVRKSNTEPIIRIIAEAKTSEAVRILAENVISRINS